MRRAYAALPRDPNEPPRKRGRPRKERPLGADESPPTTASDKSTNTDVNMRHYFANRLDSASDEEKEWADNMRTFRTSPSPSPTNSPHKSSVAAMVCHNLLMPYIAALREQREQRRFRACKDCTYLSFSCLRHLTFHHVLQVSGVQHFTGLLHENTYASLSASSTK